MLRLALALGMGLWLTLGLAWAETDLYDDDEDVISKEARAKPVAEQEDASITASGSHAMLFADGVEGMGLDSESLGSYFGSGDQFSPGTADGSTTRDADASMLGPDAEAPEYSGHGGNYSGENVYGPMWGVPAEAVGLEGYDSWEYFLLSGAVSEDYSEAHGEHQRNPAPGGQPAAAAQPAPQAESAPEPHGISCDNDD